MQYKVVRSFYEGNTLHEQGLPFDHSNKEYIEKLLNDGNIAVAGAEEKSAEEAKSSDPLVPTPPASGSEEQLNQPPESTSGQPTKAQIDQTLSSLETPPAGSETPSAN